MGPFKLVSPIGRGGMGEVWAGVHLEHQITVAIKVLTARKARNERFLKAFRREAQAVAGLHHPNVVQVFDYGEVTEDAAARSQGKLTAHSPYLAMELVDGGTLSSRRGKLAWPELRGILLGLLDALAHAHARGVIHKDLKPGNVLLDGSGGLKLSDFGLAHALDVEEYTADTPLQALGGTPAYMAPEQFEGDNRSVGPWTDLYAFGCMVWSLATGHPPFGKKPWMVVARRHINEPPPALQSSFPVPEGFEAWLHLLLAKTPAQRFRRAADAAWALMRLPKLADDLVLPPPLSPLPGTTAGTTQERTTLIWGELETQIRELPSPQPVTPAHRREVALIPPMPMSWRRPAPATEPPRLVGTGLGLYQDRSIPMVDREAERNTLWRTLRAVHSSPRPRLVVVRGPAGTGKSRLVRWLAERAHELGAATTFRASHGPIATRRDGLPAMLARHLRCMGLSRTEAEQRVRQVLQDHGLLDPDIHAAVAEYVAPATRRERDAGVRQIRFATPLERFALIRVVLALEAQERPLVLWLDDVQWGIEALQFAAQLLDDPRPLPVLMVLVARDETLGERSAESLLLHNLQARSEVLSLPVGPLSPQHSHQLVQHLLALHPTLAAQVEARVAGNPLFAVQLIGDWVKRGALELGEDGFQLKPGQPDALPDDLHQAWATTLARLLRGRPEDDGIALEIAATLGQHVDVGEWRALCVQAGLRPSSELTMLLFSERLATTTEELAEASWSFSQGMLRESLERRAREAGRLQGHHARCASYLQHQDANTHQQRIALHLLAAGAEQEALAPLRASAREALRSGDVQGAGLLLELWEQAVQRLALPPRSAERAHGGLLQARLARLQGRLDDAALFAGQAKALGQHHHDARVLHAAVREQGHQATHRGALDQAWRLHREAEKLAPAGKAHANTLADLAWVLLRRGRLVPARQAFHEAILAYQACDEAVHAAGCWRGLADIALKIGDLEHAEAWGARARDCFEALGSRRGIASSVRRRADLHRLRGDLAEAASGYQDALQRYAQLGVDSTDATELHLALVHVARHQYRDARAIAEGFLDQLGERPANLSLLAAAILLPCAADAQEWTTWDRHASRVLELLGATGLVELDLASLLHTAGRMAIDLGEGARGRAVLRASRSQLVALGRAEDLATVDVLLGPR